MSKKRPISHITGDIAINAITSFLPNEWVIRTLTPDYGIDLLIELFDFTDKEKKVCETFGEFIFVQVKGTQKLKRRKIKIYPVYNVAKSTWKEKKEEYIEVDVVNYSIDTSLLETVKRAGTSVCVLLLIVDSATNELFFICLNDLIDKYILPKNPEYNLHDTITVYIPTANKIDGTYQSLIPLRLYAKRSKLYSAFATIRYQFKELEHEISLPEIAFLDENPKKDKELEFITRKLSDFILFFANQLLQLDIWNIGNHFFALGLCHHNLKNLVDGIKSGKLNEYHSLIAATVGVWGQLDNLSSIYEEISREWFLPKFIGQLGSYENRPEVKKGL